MKQSILIVEPGFKEHKEFIVKAIHSIRNVEIIFACGLHQSIDYSWIKKYSTEVIEFQYGSNDLEKKLEEYQRSKNKKILGIITWVATSVGYVNHLQHKFKLPSICIEDSNLLINKSLVRSRLNETKLDTTWFKSIDRIPSENDLKKISKKLPLIVKPTELMGSLGVELATDIKSLRNAIEQNLKIDFSGEDLRTLYRNIATEVILEEYLIGKEFSVESYVQDGTVTILGYTSKDKVKFFEAYQTYPHKFDKILQKKLNEKVIAWHKALGIKNSITHIEFMINKDHIHFIECNARLAGDYIPRLIHKNSGIHIGKLLIAVCTGQIYQSENSNKNKKERRFAGFLTSTDEGRIEHSVSSLINNFTKNIHKIFKQTFYDKGALLFKSYPSEIFRIAEIVSTQAFNQKLLSRKIKIQKPIYTHVSNEKVKIACFVATGSDLESIIKVEKNSWNKLQAASAQKIRKRFNRNPSLFTVAYDVNTKKLVGFTCWVPVDKIDYNSNNNWYYFSNKYNQNALLEHLKYRTIVSISVLPDAPQGVGTALLKACAIRCKLGKKFGFMYGMRISGYRAASEQGTTPHQYLESIINGKVQESGMGAALCAGGEPKEILNDYYEDSESLNYAVKIVHHTKSK